ncbi:MAG: hypothetical protein J6Z11_15650, partial [Candidatus Riflebacteria bacterium]|nr:hypothetical protein [Candidatus Riflebacteria bacterium]
SFTGISFFQCFFGQTASSLYDLSDSTVFIGVYQDFSISENPKITKPAKNKIIGFISSPIIIYWHK